jgi:hypothetical protein
MTENIMIMKRIAGFVSSSRSEPIYLLFRTSFEYPKGRFDGPLMQLSVENKLQ